MNGKPTKIAAVIAAYNEEKTVGAVVRTVVASKRFSEVIVVSDGSTDRTAEIAKKNGATTVLELPVKNGKGAALLHGIAHTDAEYLFFCDADLLHFQVSHVSAVLRPVLEGRLAMCVGLRDRGRVLMGLSAYLPLIGGERALARRIVEEIPDRYLAGFMIEAALNYYCRSRRLPYGSVKMPGVTIRHKIEKVGVLRGVREYARMTAQVVRGMFLVRMAHWRGEF